MADPLYQRDGLDDPEWPHSQDQTAAEEMVHALIRKLEILHPLDPDDVVKFLKKELSLTTGRDPDTGKDLLRPRLTRLISIMGEQEG